MREEQKDSDVDPVFTIMPEFMYRRNKEMTRSEVYGVLQKLRVHVGGGDIEQIFYYFDVNNLRIDRETFYAILGGTVEAKYRTVPTKMRVGNESQEVRKRLHAAQSRPLTRCSNAQFASPLCFVSSLCSRMRVARKRPFVHTAAPFVHTCAWLTHVCGAASGEQPIRRGASDAEQDEGGAGTDGVNYGV